MKVTDSIGMVLEKKSKRKLLSITPEQTVYEALEKMAKHDVGALLVLSGNQLVGILTERDYARKGVLTGHLSRETKVHEMMTTPAQCVTPKQTVDDCMVLMTKHRIRHLPVLEGEKLVGVISVGDMVKWVISGHEQTIQALQEYISGTYPA